MNFLDQMLQKNISTLKEPDFGTSVLLFSKPLQLLNVAAIARENKLLDPIAVFYGSNSEETEFLEFIRSLYEGSLFSKILALSSLQALPDLLKDIEYDSLFVDDDRVSNFLVLQKLKKRYLIVYEEGFGTYSGHVSSTLSKVRYHKWRVLSWLTGCGLDFGESRGTDFLFVQYPDVLVKIRPHMAAKTRQMGGHVKELLQHRDAWFAILDKLVNLGDASRPALMLGTWEGAKEQDIDFILEQGHDFILYKAHPHTRREVSGCSCVVKSAWIPAEILIIYLLGRVPEVDVYHYSSSVEFYSRSLPETVRYHSFTNDLRFRQVIRATFEESSVAAKRGEY